MAAFLRNPCAIDRFSRPIAPVANCPGIMHWATDHIPPPAPVSSLISDGIESPARLFYKIPISVYMWAKKSRVSSRALRIPATPRKVE